MRLLLSLAAGAGCGAAHVAVTANVGTEVEVSASSVNDAPAEPAPSHVLEQEHATAHPQEAPSHAQELDKLYVEVSSDGDYGDTLVSSATSNLAATDFVVATQEGADIELHVELAALTKAPGAIDCKVKIFVLRLPQHDLLAIADGAGRATGSGSTPDACVSIVGGAVVRNKLPLIFEKRLEAKR